MFPATIDIATILCLGLMAGNELCVSLFVHPALRRLSDEAAQARALGQIAAVLGHAMPVWYALTFLLLAGEAYIHRAYAHRDLFYVAVIVLVFIILTTITLLVPINNRIAKLTTETPYPAWQQDHRRWDRLHWVRIFMLIAVLLCVLIGVVSQ